MPFGIPSEDFHGGFGLPHDDDYVVNYDDTDGEEDDEEYESAAQEAYDNLVRSLVEANADISILKATLKDAAYGLYVALNTYDGPSEDMLYDIAYKAQKLVMEMEAKHCGLG